MQEYGKIFAGIYNRMWTGFALQAAPLILAYYESAAAEKRRRRILDVCCGTGQLLLHFLERGFSATGVDLSPSMLACARENCARFIADGKADFINADAASFTVRTPHDLAVSTYDALNHLDSLAKLGSCFSCVRAALDPGGFFIFDLNTETGLRHWNGITVEEGEQGMMVKRGIYAPGMGRAYLRITGFARTGPDTYTRFEETAFNTLFKMEDVARRLVEAGFRTSWFATVRNLAEKVADPEELDRAFIVARA
jgi:SAM-dependent methyltransferase